MKAAFSTGVNARWLGVSSRYVSLADICRDLIVMTVPGAVLLPLPAFGGEVVPRISRVLDRDAAASGRLAAALLAV
jgi:hypothetical protein